MTDKMQTNEIKTWRERMAAYGIEDWGIHGRDDAMQAEINALRRVLSALSPSINMMAELATLPDIEALQASKITDPIGLDVLYSAPTVVRLLRAEREKCAQLCEQVIEHPAGYKGQWEGYGPVKTQRDGLECAAAIRAITATRGLKKGI